MTDRVKFLGVGKLSNKLLVASFAQGRSNEVWYKKMNALMNAPTTGANGPEDLHMRAGDSTVHVMIDALDHVFIAVTTNDYPKRLIFAATTTSPCLMTKFSQAFIDACEDAFVGCDKADGLTNKCRKLLRDLAREYNDVEKLDRLAAVQAEVSEVQLVMQDNIDKALSRGTNLSALQDKTEDLSSSANRFQKTSKAIKRKMQMRLYKVYCLCGLLIAVILAYIFVPLLTDL